VPILQVRRPSIKFFALTIASPMGLLVADAMLGGNSYATVIVGSTYTSWIKCSNFTPSTIGR
jgi:hypothetical protein